MKLESGQVWIEEFGILVHIFTVSKDRRRVQYNFNEYRNAVECPYYIMTQYLTNGKFVPLTELNKALL